MRLPGTLNLAEPLEILKRAAIIYTAECIILGKKLGAKLVSLPLGYYKNGIDKDLVINRAINDIQSIAVFARKEKILLAVENAKYLSKDSEFSYLGDNIKDLEQVFNIIKSPYVKFCLDAGRANTSEGPVKYFKSLKDRLVMLRYSDNYGRKDDMLGVEKGTIDWEELTSVIRKENFNGPLISNVSTRSVSESKQDIEKFFNN